jgi:[ribosomal protein S18]-alanine N-acetyltransferase
MENLTIEDASIRLLDQLYEIEKKCFNQEAFSKQQIAYLLNDYNSLSYIAKINDQIAGFIIAQIDMEHNQLFGHIVTIEVIAQYRRKGVAQKLLNEVETIAKLKGAKECRLEVRENNLVALKLYQKFGYKKIAKLENYYPTAHGLYLRKNLF